MTERRPIVGVVGGTGEADADQTTFDLAYALGTAATRNDVILLTGGSPEESGKSVKKAAIHGAVSAGSAENKARVIGILPNLTPVKVMYREDSSSKQLYVQTGLSRHQRNVINGTTPDVLIALAGGPGTLSEIAFAHYAQIRVVFLDSIATLKSVAGDGERVKTLHHILRTAREKYPTINGKRFDVKVIEDGVMSFINAAPDLDLMAGSLSDRANEALDKALASITSVSGERELKGRFPGIENNSDIESEFDTALAKLNAS